MTEDDSANWERRRQFAQHKEVAANANGVHPREPRGFRFDFECSSDDELRWSVPKVCSVRVGL